MKPTFQSKNSSSAHVVIPPTPSSATITTISFHFCENCRRYWTKGGALRNIPVGSGSRKNSKRSSNPKCGNPDPNSEVERLNRWLPEASSSSTSTTTTTSATQLVAYGSSNLGDLTRMYGMEPDQYQNILEMGGALARFWHQMECVLPAIHIRFVSVSEINNNHTSDGGCRTIN